MPTLEAMVDLFVCLQQTVIHGPGHQLGTVLKAQFGEDPANGVPYGEITADSDVTNLLVSPPLSHKD